MANDLNQVVLIGRLTRDPELRQIPSGQSVCSFSIANNRTYVSNGEKREETSFFNCTAWGRLAEIINQYCTRGKQIAVQGRLKQNSYDNKDGQRVSRVEVVVENMQLLGRANEPASGDYAAPAASSSSFGSPAGYSEPMSAYAPPQTQAPTPPPRTEAVPPFPSQPPVQSPAAPASPGPASDFGEDDIPF